MTGPKKYLALATLLLIAMAAGGCHPGGEAGDPTVNANPDTAGSSIGKRPGTPGAPALPPPASRDPLNGRPGASTG